VKAQKHTIARVRRRIGPALVRDRLLCGPTVRAGPGGWRRAAARLGHAGAAIGVAWLSYRLLAAAPIVGIATLPVVWFFVGSRFRALGNTMHECVHRTFVPSARWNHALGHLLSFIDFSDFTEYAREHFTHHRHLGDPEADLDYKVRRPVFEPLGALGVRHVRDAILLVHLRRFFRPLVFTRRDPPAVAVARATFNVSLVALAHFVIGWPGFLLYYVVPYVTAYQILRFFSDAVDHAGIITEPDEFYRSRNHIHAWQWVNWLIFPGHDQYHLVHHLFPQIPCAHLGRAHRLLLEVPEYAAREHDLVRLLRFGAT
jgi:fatty acid desaturase